jgi:hypothetical protein
LSNDRIKGLSIISILLVVVGLYLMFSSVSFGTSLAESWLSDQGGADTSKYLMVLKIYKNNFVIIGSMLLSASLLIAILTYFSSKVYGKER